MTELFDAELVIDVLKFLIRIIEIGYWKLENGNGNWKIETSLIHSLISVFYYCFLFSII